MCDWWFNVDCSKAEDLYFLNIEVAEKNAERQRQREAEREENQEAERQRAELSADQINDLRNGGEVPELSRSSGASNNNNNINSNRPSASFNKLTATTRKPKNSFFNNKRPSSSTNSSRNNRFSRPKPRVSAKQSSSTPKRGSKTTIGLKPADTSDNSSVQRPRRKKKKSRLRKEKSNLSSSNNQSSNFRTRPFTNFGNGQSRFGNF